MTTDDLELLREFRAEIPKPDEETRRKIYAYATSSQASRSPRSARRIRVALLNFRFAVPAVAVIGGVLAAVVFTGALGGSGTHPKSNASGRPALGKSAGTSPPAGSHPLGFTPINLNFTRNGLTISSIAVTVNSSIADATLQLQVLRTQDHVCPACSNAEHQIVFQEQVPMSQIASPASGPTGTVALSTWSGTLSPSDWDGGCLNDSYSVAFAAVPAGSSFDSPAVGPDEGESPWFTCSGT